MDPLFELRAHHSRRDMLKSGASALLALVIPSANEAVHEQRSMTANGNTFTLEMQNVAVVDQPRWPALDSIATPARMAFKMVWKSTGEPVRYEDPSKHFRFIGTRASCQLEAQVEVPSIGFSWKSDPLNASKSDCPLGRWGDEGVTLPVGCRTETRRPRLARAVCSGRRDQRSSRRIRAKSEGARNLAELNYIEGEISVEQAGKLIRALPTGF